MKRLFAAIAVFALFAAPANADVLLDPHLSGTGDNVIADSDGATSAIGHLNGSHLDVVDYTGLSLGYTGAASGNDIKFSNTAGITFQVFDPTNTFVVGTTTQVFSLKGTGDVHLAVQASDGLFTFDLGTIDPNAQSGFTLTAINGETMTMLALLDTGGTITDFEHNRIDVAVASTPIPSALWLFGSGLAGLVLMTRRKRKLRALLNA